MKPTARTWKQRLKDWSIVFGLLVLILLFSVVVWFQKETNPVRRLIAENTPLAQFPLPFCSCTARSMWSSPSTAA